MCQSSDKNINYTNIEKRFELFCVDQLKRCRECHQKWEKNRSSGNKSQTFVLYPHKYCVCIMIVMADEINKQKQPILG